MNTFTLVLVIPVLLTLASATTLFFSFKGRVDTSGRYFLLAEFLWLIGLLLVITYNINESLAGHPIYFALSLSVLLSEVSLLLSIQALTKEVDIEKFLSWIVFVLVVSISIEYCREFVSPRLPLLIASIFSLCIASATYITCKRINSNGLESNIFIKWIAYTELALMGIHLLRLTSFFSDAPMMTVNPGTLPILVFSAWLTVNLFRYFSYQSLRISWVDPRSSDGNVLNRDLVKLVKEKNYFLQGLISSNRALGISALANSLAHQLSQPITGVILQTESVKRDLIEQGNQQRSVQTLNTVTEQLGKLSELVNNLRKLFDPKDREFKPFHIQNACDEVLEVIKPTLEAKNISLEKLYTSNPIALGNPVQIQQVLINIFNNAIDAIEGSGKDLREINLIVSEDSRYAIITIQDTGSGIKTGISDTMFELYQSTKENGLGIGLWLSKTIVDKHQGSITARPNPQGGAIFEIRIPLFEYE